MVAVAALILLVLAGAGGGYYEYRQATQVETAILGHFSAAQANLQQAKILMSNAASVSDVKQLDQARVANSSARAHFMAAKRLANTDPTLQRAAQLPFASSYLRPRLAAIDGLADMGVALTDTLADGADMNEQIIKPDPGAGSGGQRLLNVLKTVQPELDKLLADLERARVAVDEVDARVLPASQAGALTTAKETIAKGLTGVQSLKQLIPVIFEIFGGNGQRTYLIEQVNPAELRAGGGFVGSFAIVQANAGTFKQIKSGGVETIDYDANHNRAQKGSPNYVPPPRSMIEFVGTNTWGLGDSNFFPDFPTNANWGKYFSDREIKVKPDGVIAIDPIAVSYLLEATGPLAIPDYNVTVEAKTFNEFLFAYENGPARATNRKDLLSAVANQLISHISSVPPNGWPGLLNAFNKAGSERHFQIFFNNQAAQDEMVKYSWAQTLNPVKAPDFMMDVESNFAGTKANHFITRAFDINLTRRGAVVHHIVTVNLVEDLNAPVVPEYDQIYRAYVRLYVPADATNLAVKDVKPPNLTNDQVTPNTLQMEGWIQITPKNKKGTYTVTYDYDTPWKPEANGTETLYLQKQAGTNADTFNAAFTDGSRTVKASGKLLTDQLIKFGDSGIAITPAAVPGASIPSIGF